MTTASVTFFHFSTVSKMSAPESSATAAAFTPPDTIQRSPWHSPVPYLFGGLAAMLGLIAFALLLLACSYWKLSGQVNGGDDGDVENGFAVKGHSTDGDKAFPAYEEKFLVIMAGDVNPTFLATPKASSVTVSGDDKINTNSKDMNQITEVLRIQDNGDVFQESELREQIHT